VINRRHVIGAGRMEIRKLEPKEHENTRNLYEEIFQEDSAAFVDYYYSEKTKDNQIYVVEEDGRIQAMLHLNPYTLMVNGVEKNAHYIVAVATRKEYRKRGYMAALIRQALRDMYLAGESFTYLMPAAESIYLPHGFCTVYEQERREVYALTESGGDSRYKEFGHGKGNVEGTDAICTVCTVKEEDCEELAVAAEKYLAENYDVYVKRDEAYYRRFLKECKSDNGKLMFCRDNGKIIDSWVLYGQENERTKEEYVEKPKIMVRILNVQKMLMSVSLKRLIAACFTITDPLIEENNCCVVITGTEFSGVMLMEGARKNSEGIITVDALASLLFGAKSVEDICREEGVEMTERLKEELGKLIPLSKIYLNEEV